MRVLLEALKDKGVTLQQQRGYTKKSFKILQEIMLSMLLIILRKKIAPGSEGKPKGLLQVLGEQGLINRASLEQCMLKGGKDAITGMVDLYYSL